MGLSDLGEICLLPSLIQFLSKEAPFIKIEIEEIQSNKVEEWLVEDFLDVAVFNSSYTVMPKIESRNLFEERYVGQFPSMEDLIKHDVKIMSSPTHLWKMGVDTLSNGIIAMEYIYKDYSEFKIEKFAAIYTIRTDYHGNTVVRGVKKDNIPGAQS